MAKRAKRISIRRRQSDEPYSVEYLAQKHDISVEQARADAEDWPGPREAQ
jgi:hypothetical protein